MAYAFRIDLEGKSAEDVAKIRDAVEKLGSKVNEVKSKVKSSVDSMGSSIKGLIGGFAAFAGIKSFLKLGSDMEQTNISFEVMLGDAERAKKLVSELQAFANVTPFTSKETAEAAKMLLNFGVAQDKVIPNLKILGDAAGGNSEKFQTMTYAFAQVMSTGRLMGQDLMQLINAGFNPLQEISRKTGRSLADLKKDVEGGKISSEMVRNAFISATSEGGRFYKMMEKQSHTVAGMWSTFVDAIQIKLIALYNAIQPVLKALISFASNFITWITGASDSAYIFKEIIIPVAAVITAIMIATKLWAAAQWALNIAMSANPIGIIIIAVVALVAAIAALWDKCEGFRRVVGGIFAAISKYIMGFVHMFMNAGKIIADIFTGNWGGLKEHSKEFIKNFKSDFTQGWGDAIKEGANKAAKSKFKFGGLIGLGGKKPEERAINSAAKAGKIGMGGAVTQGAINTSALSGASGGLGEAKVIKIDFHKALMEVNVPGGNGTDIIAKAPMSVEMMLRIINNLSQSQGSIM